MNEIVRSRGQVAVVGLGVSGLASLKFLAGQGFAVTGFDTRDAQVAKAKQLATEQGFAAEVVLGVEAERLTQAEFIVLAPGLDPSMSELDLARAKGVPVISDIQLAADHAHELGVEVIAITGSNAKSTVTTLVGDMLKKAGLNPAVGGNLGPAALGLFEQNPSVLVLEVSSFQLQSTPNLKAKVACVLNMSADHLDRHGDMLGYHTAKHKIFVGAASVVVNRSDPLTKPLVADDLPRLSFGLNTPDLNQYGVVTDAQGFQVLCKGAKRLISETELHIKGAHNLANALAALALAELAGADLEPCLEALKEFKGLAHRCRFVSSVEGVDCFNDSKATNMGATLAAVQGLGAVYSKSAQGLHLILGGQGKGQDFAELKDAVAKQVKVAYLVGEDAPLLESKLAGTTKLVHAGTLKQAVIQALAQAKPGEALLLSPACASFDQFTGYEQRGAAFESLIEAASDPN